MSEGVWNFHATWLKNAIGFGPEFSPESMPSGMMMKDDDGEIFEYWKKYYNIYIVIVR